MGTTTLSGPVSMSSTPGIVSLVKEGLAKVYLPDDKPEEYYTNGILSYEGAIAEIRKIRKHDSQVLLGCKYYPESDIPMYEDDDQRLILPFEENGNVNLYCCNEGVGGITPSTKLSPKTIVEKRVVQVFPFVCTARMVNGELKEVVRNEIVLGSNESLFKRLYANDSEEIPANVVDEYSKKDVSATEPLELLTA
ncbi:hypothetical protein COEREDRAFT_89649 [Coemansia reversa NRRL 1564]|uniref:Uncharacterized protein n=1 Tax=Coemansia reversa (strain ATCC 12441 / NRRL 1564) TaxID=763665 RepID=A0A2G5B2X6_COERN|nr:hypothetical protein COEREDRAFT_89649 [Coemansia reversa NRRL 1564]|eukprot:PIA13370.1 hypothetical protein COEREDRAFT_89649 [Coemansia reversa NRRL 1564]